MWAFHSLTGVCLGEQDGMSNQQHKSERWEGWCQNPALKEERTSIKIEPPDPTYPAHPDSENTDEYVCSLNLFVTAM